MCVIDRLPIDVTDRRYSPRQKSQAKHPSHDHSGRINDMIVACGLWLVAFVVVDAEFIGGRGVVIV